MQDYNDYELICLAREGNEDAVNILYNKYKPIIVSKSSDAIVMASHHGIEINDIMQEGFIGLEEAIMGFSEKDNTSFYTFAVLCINRQIINYLRKMTKGKDRILNDAIAIDETIEKNICDDFNAEFSLISQEEEKNMIKELEKNFTKFERDVFKFKIDGYSFEEIANILNRDVKSIYNTFQRIKIKVKKVFKKDNYL